MGKHEFGGGWTEIKLDLLERYLKAWLQVMHNKRFDLLYIDAFAGNGKCVSKRDGGEVDGSALRALRCEGINTYYFFEKACDRADELKKACDAEEFSGKEVIIESGDANDLVKHILKKHDWRRTRAVLFLDPYGMEVEWSTLEAISLTKAIDLWYLFSISGLFRNAARKFEAVDAGKEAIITRMLGTDEWKSAFYQDTGQPDLFTRNTTSERHMDVDDLEIYVKERLQTIFPMVLDPRRLVQSRNAPLFSLFFAVSNPSEAAQQPAKRIAGHIINNI
ncbi:MAG: three-Cys-motif partner protein TcmP [Halioglobus sp.]